VKALMLMSLLLAASCSTYQETQPAPAAAPAPAPPPVPVAPPTRQTRAKPAAVKASFQGDETAGRLTASGEPYDPNELTAASKTLPIGSTVRVTNPKTGKSVKVRINDRGPHVRGRSLDLSTRAAEEVGITKNGVARLKIQRVDAGAAESKSTNTPQDSVPASTSTP
jgi:rare lipoprotein A